MYSFSDIPGTYDVPGRRYVYIEAPSGGDGTKIQSQISAILKKRCAAGNPPLNGGMLFDECKIVCPDKRTLYSFSYRGDLDGWNGLVEQYAQLNSLATAVIDGDRIVLSDDSAFALAECAISGSQQSPSDLK